MANYPCYENCVGCETRLPERGTPESESVRALKIEILIEGERDDYEVYYHPNCKEKAIANVQNLLKGFTHHIS